MATATDFGDLLTAMKRAAAALLAAEVPFMLAGGLASWARGGPPTDHDVDFMLKPEHVDVAATVLADAGFRIEQPPEEWLRKAWLDDVLIDLIHHPARMAVDDALLRRAEEMEVHAMAIPVISPEDLLATKLRCMDEHHADFESVLEIGRSLREQIDWDVLRERTVDAPFAQAYLVLVQGLGLAEAAA